MSHCCGYQASQKTHTGERRHAHRAVHQVLAWLQTPSWPSFARIASVILAEAFRQLPNRSLEANSTSRPGTPPHVGMDQPMLDYVSRLPCFAKRCCWRRCGQHMGGCLLRTCLCASYVASRRGAGCASRLRVLGHVDRSVGKSWGNVGPG